MTQINEIIKKFVSNYELEPTVRPGFHLADIVRIQFSDNLELILPGMNIRGRVGDYVSWFATPMIFNNDWTIKDYRIARDDVRRLNNEVELMFRDNAYYVGTESFEARHIHLSRYRPGVFQRVASELVSFSDEVFSKMNEGTFGILPVCHFDEKTYILSIEDCTDLLIFDYKRFVEGRPEYTGEAIRLEEFDIRFMSLENYAKVTTRTMNAAMFDFRDALRSAINVEKKLSPYYSSGIESHFMADCYAKAKIMALSKKLENTTFPWTVQACANGFSLHERAGDGAERIRRFDRYYSYSKVNWKILEAVLEIYKTTRIHKKDGFSEAFAREKAEELLHGMYVVDGWIKNTFLFHGLKEYEC